MKKIAAIILAFILLIGVGSFTVLYFSKEGIIFTGNAFTQEGKTLSLNRVYVSDKNEVANVQAILNKINQETPSPTSQDIIDAITENGHICFSPNFLIEVADIGESKGIVKIIGSFSNTPNHEDNAKTADYIFENIRLDTGVTGGFVQYGSNRVGEEILTAKTYTLPVISENQQEVSFLFNDSNQFEFLVSTSRDGQPIDINLQFTFDFKARKLINFTTVKDETLGVNIHLEYDNGKYIPTFTVTDSMNSEGETTS